MIPGPDAQRARVQLLVWWIIWTSMLIGLCLIYFLFGWKKPLPATLVANTLFNLIGLVPLFLSIIIRWLVLPRFTEIKRVFPFFVVGLALAEACGLLGIFLGGPYRDDLFLLSVLGIIQFMPFFTRTYLAPRSTGFIPNN